MINLSRMLALTAAAVAIFVVASEAKAGGYARTRFAAPVYQQQFFAAPQQFGGGYSYQRESFQQFNGGYQQQFAAPVPVYNGGLRFRNRFAAGPACYGLGVCPPVQTFGAPAYGFRQSRGFSFQFQRSRGVGFGY